jgi:hypothetical protein
MGILDVLFGPRTVRHIVTLATDGRGRASTGTSSAATGSKDIKIGDTKIDYKKYELAIRRHPLVARAVDLRASLVLGKGFKIVCDDKKSLDCVNDFILKVNHNVKNGSRFNFFMKQLVKDADAFGNSWQELIFNSSTKQGMDLKRIHPVTFDFKRGNDEKIIVDDFGNPVAGAWKNEDGGYSPTDIPLDAIIHHAHNFLGDEILGISMLEPCYQTLSRLMNIEEGIAESILRHGFPIYDIEIGGVGPYDKLGEDEFSAIEEQMKGLNERSELTHGPNVKTKILESQRTSNMRSYPDHFVEMVCSNFGLPKWLLLAAGDIVSRAAAQEMTKLIPATIEPLQEALKFTLEDQLFRKVIEAAGLSDVPTIEFEDMIPVDIYRAARGISTAAGVNISGQPLITIDEARRMLKIPQPKAAATLPINQKMSATT